jgi:hypothetical protein
VRLVAGHTRVAALDLILSKEPGFVPRDAPGVGLVPVRGASPRDAEALDQIVAFALLMGHDTTTAPGLEVIPDIPEVEGKRPIGFRP